jgi:hypothetical protein
MFTSRKPITASFCAAALAGLVGFVTSSQAAISIGQTDTPSYSNGVTSGFTTWPVVPNTADAAGWSAGSYVGNGAEIGQFDSAQGFNATLGQSFAALTTGTLTDVEMEITGNPSGVTVNLAIYSAGAASGNSLADTGSNTYAPGVGAVSTNLLAADATGVVLPAYGVVGTTGAIFDFQFSGADAITLTAGQEYIFEVGTTSTAILWPRMANNALDYPAGQGFSARSPINGNALRDLSLGVAVSAVPEPTSLGLIGLSCLGMLRRRSRQS